MVQCLIQPLDQPVLDSFDNCVCCHVVLTKNVRLHSLTVASAGWINWLEDL